MRCETFSKLCNSLLSNLVCLPTQRDEVFDCHCRGGAPRCPRAQARAGETWVAMCFAVCGPGACVRRNPCLPASSAACLEFCLSLSPPS